VLYVGYDNGGWPAHEVLEPGLRVERIPLARITLGTRIPARIVQFLLWNAAVVWRYRKARAELVQAHLLAGLPCAVVLSLIHGVPLLYDAHELETERHGWSNFIRRCARLVERVLIRFADRVIVVSPLISQWYKDHYGIEAPIVVRNIPRRRNDTGEAHGLLRQNLGIPVDSLVFLYVGLISESRGAKQCIDAFSSLNTDKHLVFMGFGPLVDYVRRAAENNNSIHYHQPVPSSDVCHYASSADIGLLFLDLTSLSYRYALPNKFFEYRVAGLPVIYPKESAQIDSYIQQYGGGWEFDNTVDGFRNLVNRLSPQDVDEMKAVVRKNPKPSWEEEARIYIAVLKDLLDRKRPSGAAI
jgi:glycosyltransferase involved in cell wall biosynthesis